MVSLGPEHEQQRTGRQRRSRAQQSRDRWSAVAALFVAALVSAGLLAATVYLLGSLTRSGTAGPETALSLVFVAAAVVLIFVVCTLTIVLRHLRLTNRREAMGLPSGSIRAVIALLLILLFFIAAIFLFSSTRHTGVDRQELRRLTGIDAARFSAIPTDLIQQSTSRTVGADTVYDVTLSPAPLDNRTSDDLAKQLITTVGTLVTAVAAFYFGANTVRAAHKDQAGIATIAAGIGPPRAAAEAAAEQAANAEAAADRGEAAAAAAGVAADVAGEAADDAGATADDAGAAPGDEGPDTPAGPRRGAPGR
jgi:hypothetical protein